MVVLIHGPQSETFRIFLLPAFLEYCVKKHEVRAPTQIEPAAVQPRGEISKRQLFREIDGGQCALRGVPRISDDGHLLFGSSGRAASFGRSGVPASE